MSKVSMNSIILLPEAVAEIEASANFYKTQVSGLEILFLDEIENATMKIYHSEISIYYFL